MQPSIERGAQNYLMPEHVEKIATTFYGFRDVERYARVVGMEELAENDYNLNMRRDADNAPPPEPHDVRAHLPGGVPKAETLAKRELFETVDLSPNGVFDAGDGEYAHLRSDLGGRLEIMERIEADAGVQEKLGKLRSRFGVW